MMAGRAQENPLPFPALDMPWLVYVTVVPRSFLLCLLALLVGAYPPKRFEARH